MITRAVSPKRFAANCFALPAANSWVTTSISTAFLSRQTLNLSGLPTADSAILRGIGGVSAMGAARTLGLQQGEPEFRMRIRGKAIDHHQRTAVFELHILQIGVTIHA